MVADLAERLDRFMAGVWLRNAKGESVWVARGLCNDYDGWFGCQCMDLTLYWSQYLGLPMISAGSALLSWNLRPEGYEKIGAGAQPRAGDIVVWGTHMGSHGHIAIFVSGDASGFTSYDQNYPEGSDYGSAAKTVRHTYAGLLGWFRPLVPETPAAPPPPPVAIHSADA